MRPSRNDHLSKAKRNRDFAYNLPKRDATHIGWALTALFYSALHYVEGYLAGFSYYVRNHDALKEEIHRNPELRSLYEDYRDLFDYAYNARYRMRNYSEADFEEAKASFRRIRNAHHKSREPLAAGSYAITGPAICETPSSPDGNCASRTSSP